MDHVQSSPDNRFVRYSKVLGRGAFKTVFLGFDRDEARDIAWNSISLRSLRGLTREQLMKEVEILSKVTHPNIMDFYSQFILEKENELVLITEVVVPGVMRDFLDKCEYLRVKVIQKWANQILSAICYLHSQNIIHRDIKCDNIFINGAASKVKLGDMGFATFLDHRNAVESIVGTPEFLAPEVYNEKYGTKVDVYAFGMSVLEMVTLEFPYSECKSILAIYKTVSGHIQPLSLYRIVDVILRDFIQKATTFEEKDRPTAEELLKHPFLSHQHTDKSNLIVSLFSPEQVQKWSETNSLPSLDDLKQFHTGKMMPNTLPESQAFSQAFSNHDNSSPVPRGSPGHRTTPASPVPPHSQSSQPSSPKTKSQLNHSSNSVQKSKPVLTISVDCRIRASLISYDSDKLKCMIRMRVQSPDKVKPICVKFPYSLRTDTPEFVAKTMVEDLLLSPSEFTIIHEAISSLLTSASTQGYIPSLVGSPEMFSPVATLPVSYSKLHKALEHTDSTSSLESVTTQHPFPFDEISSGFSNTNVPAKNLIASQSTQIPLHRPQTSSAIDSSSSAPPISDPFGILNRNRSKSAYKADQPNFRFPLSKDGSGFCSAPGSHIVSEKSSEPPSHRFVQDSEDSDDEPQLGENVPAPSNLSSSLVSSPLLHNFLSSTTSPQDAQRSNSTIDLLESIFSPPPSNSEEPVSQSVPPSLLSQQFSSERSSHSVSTIEPSSPHRGLPHSENSSPQSSFETDGAAKDSSSSSRVPLPFKRNSHKSHTIGPLHKSHNKIINFHPHSLGHKTGQHAKTQPSQSISLTKKKKARTSSKSLRKMGRSRSSDEPLGLPIPIVDVDSPSKYSSSISPMGSQLPFLRARSSSTDRLPLESKGTLFDSFFSSSHDVATIDPLDLSETYADDPLIIRSSPSLQSLFSDTNEIRTHLNSICSDCFPDFQSLPEFDKDADVLISDFLQSDSYRLGLQQISLSLRDMIKKVQKKISSSDNNGHKLLSLDEYPQNENENDANSVLLSKLDALQALQSKLDRIKRQIWEMNRSKSK